MKNNYDPNILNLNIVELQSWLSRWLQLPGEKNPDISMIYGEVPFEKPFELWKKGSELFRGKLGWAIIGAFNEAAAKPWEAGSFHELCMLIGSTKFKEIIPWLVDIVDSGKFLRVKNGKQLQMLALRTLIELKWKGTIEFWHEQKKAIGEQWPVIIFIGFAELDLDYAMSEVPGLVKTKEHAQDVLVHLDCIKLTESQLLEAYPIEAALLIGLWKEGK